MDEPKGLGCFLRDDAYAADFATQKEELKKDRFMAEAAAARAERYQKPELPRYHFVNADGYMNDPNGLCYWNGRWHLLFQQLYGKAMLWGHAVSRDLVHWTELPYAIRPEPVHNEESCWSGGSCVTDKGVAVMYYGHGGHTGLYCQQSHDDLLLNWNRTTSGPAVPGCEEEPEYHRIPYAAYPALYDATVFFENGRYYAISAGVARRADDTFTRQEYLFSSDDLTHWTYEHPFLVDDAFQSNGDDGACPYFVKFGKDEDRRLLVTFSHRNGPVYVTGTLDRKRMVFSVSGSERLSPATIYDGYMAPTAFADPSGDGTVRAMYIMHCPGTDACMSLPHTLHEISRQRIRTEPAKELESLRRNHRHVEDISLEPGTEVVIEQASGKCVEINCTLCFEADAAPSLHLFRSPDGSHYTALNIYPGRGEQYRDADGWHQDCVLSIDCSHTAEDPCRLPAPEIVTVPYTDGSPLELRIYLDNSVVEVFTKTGRSLARRLRPTQDGCTFSFYTPTHKLWVKEMDIYDMEPIGETFSDVAALD